MKLESESRFKYVFRKDHGDCLIFGVVKNFIVDMDVTAEE